MRKRREKMGKIEERDAMLSFARKHMPTRPKRTFIDILLYPVRALREWNRRREIRKNIWKKP
jgi:hypothetical protein